MATLPITKRGAEKLKAELHKLKTVDRPWVIAAIAEARAQGDLSENAEYEAAKDRQGFIEGRIQELEGKLGNAEIIDVTSMEPTGKVIFGSTIDLEDEDNGAKVTYQIVGEDEAEGQQHRADEDADETEGQYAAEDAQGNEQDGQAGGAADEERLDEVVDAADDGHAP